MPTLSRTLFAFNGTVNVAASNWLNIFQWLIVLCELKTIHCPTKLPALLDCWSYGEKYDAVCCVHLLSRKCVKLTSLTTGGHVKPGWTWKWDEATRVGSFSKYIRPIDQTGMEQSLPCLLSPRVATYLKCSCKLANQDQ